MVPGNGDDDSQIAEKSTYFFLHVRKRPTLREHSEILVPSGNLKQVAAYEALHPRSQNARDNTSGRAHQFSFKDFGVRIATLWVALSMLGAYSREGGSS